MGNLYPDACGVRHPLQLCEQRDVFTPKFEVRIGKLRPWAVVTPGELDRARDVVGPIQVRLAIPHLESDAAESHDLEQTQQRLTFRRLVSEAVVRIRKWNHNENPFVLCIA